MAHGHGGRRPGAGAKKGVKRKLTDEAVAKAIAARGSKTPLEFLLETMLDQTKEFNVRLDAAKAAAPYVHARMIEHSGKVVTETYVLDAPAQMDDADEWQRSVTH